VVTLRPDVALAPLTTWRIGGPAAWYGEPASGAELAEAVVEARRLDLPFVVLGRGSNVLVPDEGLEAVVACTRSSLTDLRIEGDEVVAGAGAFLPNVARAARAAGLTGFECFAGIPGTVGAAVAINAGIGGTGGPCVADTLVEAEVVDDEGGLSTRTAGELALGYRGSAIFCRGWVTSARLRATGTDDPKAIAEREREHLRDRATRQPLNDRSTGSVFKPAPDGTTAGELLDRAGLKGFRVGDAAIAEGHANWILNLGHASSDDVRAVIATAETEVLERFDVQLEREVVVLPDDLAARATI
jgi:UDP-N-acetylmuramate dehydrogenase